MTAAELCSQILDLDQYQAGNLQAQPFLPGETPVPVSGKVLDDDDLRSLVDASPDFWLTKPH
jgi:CDP-6-deoxy-D-xylo-4-hexulose-3-dehydrase